MPSSRRVSRRRASGSDVEAARCPARIAVARCSEVPGEDFGPLPVLGRERSRRVASLEIHDAARTVVADRRAEDRLDLGVLHARAAAETARRGTPTM
jgi:hypothetical protein